MWHVVPERSRQQVRELVMIQQARRIFATAGKYISQLCHVRFGELRHRCFLDKGHELSCSQSAPRFSDRHVEDADIHQGVHNTVTRKHGFRQHLVPWQVVADVFLSPSGRYPLHQGQSPQVKVGFLRRVNCLVFHNTILLKGDHRIFTDRWRQLRQHRGLALFRWVKELEGPQCLCHAHTIQPHQSFFWKKLVPDDPTWVHLLAVPCLLLHDTMLNFSGHARSLAVHVPPLLMAPIDELTILKCHCIVSCGHAH
mmetsp:Transcript_44723/g.112452  ORF Transcript_44723/g.112452 Transcript_44723/m.112452 type:complete len:254 (-) Transcript_44723:2520-3281(-)